MNEWISPSFKAASEFRNKNREFQSRADKIKNITAEVQHQMQFYSEKYPSQECHVPKIITELLQSSSFQQIKLTKEMLQRSGYYDGVDALLNNLTNKSIASVLLEWSNSATLSAFLSSLNESMVSYLLRQTEERDVIKSLDSLNEKDIQLFKAYSTEALNQEPERLLANESENPSKYGQLIISIISELLRIFFYPYLFLLLQAQVDLPFLDKTTVVTEKQLIITAKRDFCEEQLSICRFVKSKKLNVRASAGKKYQVIDTLHFGQGVIIDAFEVNENDRDWVFINYYDKTSESYKNGWVFRRYLKRYVP
jgi:hypothetical protein